jgi:hypothetical protein
MVAVPGAIGVTVPPASIVAVPGADEAHVPPDGVPIAPLLLPIHTVEGVEIMGTLFTLTITLEKQPPTV